MTASNTSICIGNAGHVCWDVSALTAMVWVISLPSLLYFPDLLFTVANHSWHSYRLRMVNCFFYLFPASSFLTCRSITDFEFCVIQPYWNCLSLKVYLLQQCFFRYLYVFLHVIGLPSHRNPVALLVYVCARAHVLWREKKVTQFTLISMCGGVYPHVGCRSRFYLLGRKVLLPWWPQRAQNFLSKLGFMLRAQN